MDKEQSYFFMDGKCFHRTATIKIMQTKIAHGAFGLVNLYEGIFKNLAHALRLQRFLIAQVLPYSSNLLEMCFKETRVFLAIKLVEMEMTSGWW